METITLVLRIVGIIFLGIEIRALLLSIRSTMRVSKWMKKKERNDFPWQMYFMEDWKEKSISYRIYQWIVEKISFQLIMLKLWYVNNFSKDEFHPWLNMELWYMNELSPKQRKKYLAMLDKIRRKKDLLIT